MERTPDLVPPVPWRNPDEVFIEGLRVAFYIYNGIFPASPERVILNCLVTRAKIIPAVVIGVPPCAFRLLTCMVIWPHARYR